MWHDICLPRVSLQNKHICRFTETDTNQHFLKYAFNIWSVGCCAHQTEYVNIASRGGLSMLFICALFCISGVLWNVSRSTHTITARLYVSAVFLTSEYFLLTFGAPGLSSSYVESFFAGISGYIKNAWFGYLECYMLHHLNLCQPICYVHLEDVSVCLCHIEISPLNYMTFLESKNNHGTDGEGVGWHLSVLSLGFKSRM